MSGIIQLLPEHVANQIAAGEVVQRPASVVKELLENAVDARATDVKLLVKDAGKSLIQVIDNGLGMNAQDARLCFERHATSKIRIAEDLFALHSKGFRGEALASIAAIAQVELKTRQEQDELGTRLVIEGSKFTSEELGVLPKGTSFSVKNLFYNIPARRNFLKSDLVEQRHIIDEFQRVALAHPNIYFSLYHNGSEAFNLPASNLRQRIVTIFGAKTNEKLVPVQEMTDIVSLQGFVGKPEFAKKGRGEQFFFVNDRFIRSGYLHHAVMAAYEGLIKDGCQPSYFLFLEVPPHTIDINIHPTKTEIKFDDEHALYAIMRSAIKHALGQFNVAPVLDFDRDPNLDTPYTYKDASAVLPRVEFNAAFNPFGDPKPTWTRSQNDGYKKEPTASWQGLYTGLRQDAEYITAESPVLELESEGTLSLFDEQVQQITKTYQIHRKYLISPIKSGMLIIDQQRAHQRILYEQFLTNITVDQASSQQLLFPLTLYFSANEMELLAQLKSALECTGFVFESLQRDHAIISGLPVHVCESEASIVLEQLLGDLLEGIPGNGFSQNDGIAKSMSRSLAVKTGTLLAEREQENLVNGLFACKEPGNSPFNKTTFITLSVEDLDKRFAL